MPVGYSALRQVASESSQQRVALSQPAQSKASRAIPVARAIPRSGAISSSSEFMLHRVSAGDQTAVQDCISRFGGLVWMLARRVGLPESEIDDAVHEVFTELWKHGHKYDPSIASETAFVATIARRRLIDKRRKVSRQPIKEQLFEETRVTPSAEPRAFVTEEAKRAEAALTQLSNEQQRVLRLSVYEGLSHELIARSTGLPLGTVKTHARRGLIKLRELLGVATENNGSETLAAEASGAGARIETVTHRTAKTNAANSGAAQSSSKGGEA